MEVEDPDVKHLLRNNADIRRTKEAAVAAKKRTIDELEEELGRIRGATAQFSIFLKRNAIMPYNDATLEYLDRCLEEEMHKVVAGGSQDKLESLKRYRREYEQEIKVLEGFMNDGDGDRLLDQQGIHLLMRDLFSLTHYGDTLRNMNDVIDRTHRCARRETPHIMRGSAHSKKPNVPAAAASRDGSEPRSGPWSPLRNRFRTVRRFIMGW